MADVKITALPAATVLVAGTDVLPLVTGGGATTNKATPTQIVTSALTATPVTVAQGGTNATTAAGARTNLGAASSGANSDITSLTGLTTPLSVARGGTAQTAGNYGVYDYEIHVSQVDGNDTTGNGDLINPVATITKALTLVAGDRRTVIIHPGTYTESPSITYQYTALTGPGLIGGNVLISGTVSTNIGCTISGLKITNLTSTTASGAGNVNILNCDISGTFTKSGTADYTLLRLTDFAAANITGAGVVDIYGGNTNFLTVNSASANVLVKNGTTVAPVLTSGSLSLVQTVVVAAVTNAVTTSAGTVVTLANSQLLTAALTNVAPVVLNGFYSIFNCVYDKPSSTLATLSATGGSLNAVDYFQRINTDNISFTVYTVATLPSASTYGKGTKAFVSDALSPTYGATVASGGAVATPVYSDGTNWKVG